MNNMTSKLAGIAVLGIFAFFLSTVTRNIPQKQNSDVQAQAVNTDLQMDLKNGESPSEAVVTKFSKPLISLVVPKYLDNQTLNSCLSDKTISESISKTSLFSGDKGTPLLYIGNNKYMYEVQGALPYEWFGYILADIKAGKEFTIPIEAKENIVKITDPKILSAVLITNDEAVRGDKNGSISIVEYSDTSCPFCQRVHPTLQKIVKDFPETKWVYRHHPLFTIHPHATEEAIALECVRLMKDSRSYWEMLDTLMLSPLSY